MAACRRRGHPGLRLSIAPPTTTGPTTAGNRPQTLRTHRLSVVDTTAELPNPFTNATRTASCAQRVKMALMCITLVVPLRVVIMGIATLLMVVLTRSATCCRRNGGMDREGRPVPLSRWRLALLYPLRWLLRVILWCFGVWWISEKYEGCCGPSPGAHIVTPNHVSFLDALYFATRMLPCPVAKAELRNAPIVGGAFMALQPVLVWRTTGDGRMGALDQIKYRIENGGFPPVLIFPEGTTSNNTALTMFKRGAFVPGRPVQPVAIKYPFKYNDVSWGVDVPIVTLLFRTLCQVYTPMEVTWLPVYEPNEEEQRDPIVFANNVREQIADALDVPATGHAYEDVKFMLGNKRYIMENVLPKADVNSMKRYLDADLTQIQELVAKFRAADKDETGRINQQQFAEALGLPQKGSDYASRLFAILDRDHDGTIDFREMVLALSMTLDHIDHADRLKFGFTVYDRDGDKKISREELMAILEATYHAADAAELATRVAGIFDRFDEDDDGMLSFDEFVKMAEADAELLDAGIAFAHERLGFDSAIARRFREKERAGGPGGGAASAGAVAVDVEGKPAAAAAAPVGDVGAALIPVADGAAGGGGAAGDGSRS